MGDITNCSKCHVVRGEGAKLAPDLSNLVQRDYDSVLRDIREPSAAINPEFLKYSVLTHEGQVLSGTIVRESDAMISLADQTGKIVDVSREDIEELKPSVLSNVPQDVIEKLSPAQLLDLMTFLLVDASSEN